MRKVLASSLTALLLTGVAVAPLATGFTILTADAAYAKSDKAKGGGSDKAAKGKSGEKAAARVSPLPAVAREKTRSRRSSTV